MNLSTADLTHLVAALILLLAAAHAGGYPGHRGAGEAPAGHRELLVRLLHPHLLRDRRPAARPDPLLPAGVLPGLPGRRLRPADPLRRAVLARPRRAEA